MDLFTSFLMVADAATQVYLGLLYFVVPQHTCVFVLLLTLPICCIQSRAGPDKRSRSFLALEYWQAVNLNRSTNIVVEYKLTIFRTPANKA